MDNAAAAAQRHHSVMFGGMNIWRMDAWDGRRRDRDELKTAEMGPSAAVYINRFGGDVRSIGKLLPNTSRELASTLLRCHRLAPSGTARRATRAAGRVPTGIKKIPTDIVATQIIPFLVEDEDHADDSADGAVRTVQRLLRTQEAVLRDLRLDDAVRSWSDGERGGIWAKFILDFATGYDQTVAIQAIYIIHTLWWRLNENGENADDMLREVQRRFNTKAGQLSEASLLLCASALELSTALSHKTLDTIFHNIFTSSGPQLRVADVGDYIQERIGWRIMVTSHDNLLAHYYKTSPVYEHSLNLSNDYVEGRIRARCDAVSRVVACYELLYPLPPTIIAAAILLHVRKTMRIDPAWSPALESITGGFSEIHLEPVRRDLVKWVPNPANVSWPWAHGPPGMGGDSSDDDADY